MGRTVLDVLQAARIYVEAPCGGAGTCGKCLVQVNGVPCLACQTQEVAGADVRVGHSSNFTVLEIPTVEFNEGANFGLAVDIGTTTIAFALVDLERGQPVFSYGMVNSQRALGADVISRIKAADDGKFGILNELVLKDILLGITYVCEKVKISANTIKKMYVAGNTTMLHILMNVSVHSLGQFPFTPVFINLQCKPFDEIFKTDLLNCDVTLLPGISTYVGADVAAGILYCDSFDESAEYMLVDLGTNGELALFTEGNLTGTATAAGPAFEAGNISCGVGSIPGAIYKAKYESNKLKFETIDGMNPVGICGSGLLDIAAQLAANEIIDEAGGLDDDITIAPGIIFTQKDVRELQLAKSAVRAGIEILLEENGGKLKKLYLAGGFGHNLNLESAVALGILPNNIEVQTVGNSSLAGCVLAISDETAIKKLVELTARAREINLSAHPRFNDLFMDYMMFEN